MPRSNSKSFYQGNGEGLHEDMRSLFVRNLALGSTIRALGNISFLPPSFMARNYSYGELQKFHW